MAMLNLTKENFDEVIQKNDIVVVDCWADWCVPCRNFEPIFQQVSLEYPDVVFGKLNTEQQPELAAEFTIRSIPTIMIFRQKIMVFCESGLLPASALKDLIEQAKKLNMDEVYKQLTGGVAES